MRQLGNLERAFIGTWMLSSIFAGITLGCDNPKADDTGGSGLDAGLDAASPSGTDLWDSLNGPGDLFSPDALLTVDIAMPDSDWDALRTEGRQLPRVYAGCFDFPGYTYFDATVTINGEAVESVSVRKKGFLGSLSMFRPSLKMNYGRDIYKGRTFHGEKRFTLNNNKQDLSNVRQCLSYALFAKAGVKAPQCNLAKVTAQGQDLGIYSHVEAIKKPFLKRAFGDDSGNLYEGQVSDFNDGLVSTFQPKTNGGEDGYDTSDLQAVVDALKTDDAALWDTLDGLIDMDAFLTFWAMEVLVGHWDSYTGNQNNFYIYHNPTDDRFHFIPWGTDGAFTADHGEVFVNVPVSTYSASELASRLWNIPENRARYEQRLKELMNTLWDEPLLNSEVDRMGALTGAPADQLNIVKQFINNRQALIEAELNAGSAPSWPEPPMDIPIQCTEPAPTTGAFEIPWSDTHAYGMTGIVTFTLSIAGEPITFSGEIITASGPVQEIEDPMYGVPRIAFLGTTENDSRTIWVGLYIPEPVWHVGTVEFHGYEVFGFIAESITDTEYVRLGLIGDGTITLEQAGRTEGATVKGTWSGFVATDPTLLY